MIKGKNIILTNIKESDLRSILELTSDFSEIGEYYPFFFDKRGYF